MQCGIQDAAQALKNLELMRAELGAEGYAVILPGLLAALALAADSDMALNNCERYVSALGDVPSFRSICRTRPDVLDSLVTIFGASRFLSTFLVTIADESLPFLSDPGFLAKQSDRQRLSERLASLTRGGTDDKSFYRMLRLFRKQEMLRIGLRDLLGKADFRETVEDLSDLAEVCLQKAYEWADAGLRSRYGKPLIEGPDGTRIPAGFAVIAMGKLGGRELNCSSDVDLMYVYSADGETEGASPTSGQTVNKITNHQYFIKLSEKLSAAIGEKTEDGFVFRVDLRLRPEGRGGPPPSVPGGVRRFHHPAAAAAPVSYAAFAPAPAAGAGPSSATSRAGSSARGASRASMAPVPASASKGAGGLGSPQEEADRLLYLLVDQRYSPEDCVDAGFAEQFVRLVIERMRRNHFKRVLPPIAKVSNRTIGYDFLYLRDWGT